MKGCYRKTKKYFFLRPTTRAVAKRFRVGGCEPICPTKIDFARQGYHPKSPHHPPTHPPTHPHDPISPQLSPIPAIFTVQTILPGTVPRANHPPAPIAIHLFYPYNASLMKIYFKFYLY